MPDDFGVIIAFFRKSGYMFSKYLISISRAGVHEKETIHDPETKLKVGVFDPIESGFTPRKGEVHYFVSDHKNDILLAFETVGYRKSHKTLVILDMIARYCVYLGFVEAQIHSTWPLIR